LEVVRENRNSVGVEPQGLQTGPSLVRRQAAASW
jgi:hypothetical protein